MSHSAIKMQGEGKLAGAAIAQGLAGHRLVGGEQLGVFCITSFSWVCFFSSLLF